MNVYEVKRIKGIGFGNDALEVKAHSIYEVPTKVVNLTGWSAFDIYKNGKLEMRFGY